MSRDYDRKRRVVGNEKKQKSKRPPVIIVHLDDGHGRALCSLPQPFPSQAHSLAVHCKNPIDICLTCNWCLKERQRGTTD